MPGNIAKTRRPSGPAAVAMFSLWLTVYNQFRRTHKEVVWRLR